MNLALGALIILLLVYPGIVVRISYLEGPYSRKTIDTSLLDELVISLIPALILQVIGFLVIEYWTHYTIKIDLLYQIISGPSPAFKTEPDFVLLKKSIPLFLSYNLIQIVAAICLGRISRVVVEHYKWDIKYHFLRFYNEWYYLLSGRILDGEDMEGNSNNVSFIQADLLLETKDGSYIYSGLIANYFLSKESGLDRIYLKNVYRRKLTEDDLQDSEITPEETAKYYNMPGDLFAIPYSEIKNINISYQKLIPQTSNEKVNNESLSFKEYLISIQALTKKLFTRKP